MINLSKILVNARKDIGLSQQALASAADLSIATIQNIEADKYVAFYYSDNPLFLKKIKKINNKIKWNPIKNKNVLDLLFKFNNHSFGPYNFIFEKNKIKFINTIN